MDFSLPVSRPRTYLVAVHVALGSLSPEGGVTVPGGPRSVKSLGGLSTPGPGNYETKFHARIKQLSAFLKTGPINLSDFLLQPGAVIDHWQGNTRKTTNSEIASTGGEVAACLVEQKFVRCPGSAWDKKHETIFKQAKFARPEYEDMRDFILSMEA